MIHLEQNPSQFHSLFQKLTPAVFSTHILPNVLRNNSPVCSMHSIMSYLSRLDLAGDMVEGELEVVLVAEFGRQPDFDLLVKVGILVMPSHRQIGMPEKFRRRGFAENHRHRERLVLTTHELHWGWEGVGGNVGIGEG